MGGIIESIIFLLSMFVFQFVLFERYQVAMPKLYGLF